MESILFISRLLFSALFLISALNHFTNLEGMAAYTKSRGVPAAKVAVLLSGVILALGSVMLITGLWADLGALLLFVFLIPTALLMHPFWREEDPMTKMNEQIAFMKDLSLAGGALAIFAFYELFAKVSDATQGGLFGWPLFH
ncbi:MAG: DoxX family protein [Actinomycetales bacterium]|nr:DoxX family protein [Actinomycetales bacterium]